MAPPASPAGAAGACELLPAAPEEPQAPSPPPPPPPPHHGRDVAKGRGHGPHRQGAGARILSLGVQAAVMGAAIAIFLLFAAASALLLLVLVLAARAFRHHRGSRYRVPSSLDYPSFSTAPSSPQPLRAGLSPADLRRLPCFAFPSGGGGSPSPNNSSNTACAVCLEAATAGERWRAMPACRHAFHAACVDRWLARSPACPVCRAAVAAPTS